MKKNLIKKSTEILLDKNREIEMAFICMLARGHLLIEDLPGTGKTTMVHLLAKLTGLDFKRIQFTNDLLPSDVIGNMVYSEKSGQFDLHRGPIFTELVLADELNRASPRTQSALLQAMEESEVTIDGKTLSLPQPFFLIATQNPRHQIGTSPLPESQIDRFLMSMEMEDLSKKSQIQIIQGLDAREAIKTLQPLFTKEEFLQHQAKVDEILIAESVAEYISNLIGSSELVGRNHRLSIRSGISLANASKAYAYSEDRKFVLPDDVQKVAPFVLAHRLSPLEGLKKGVSLAEELLQATPVAV